MLCNGFVRLRFHRVIQQQYDSYTPQLTSGGLKPGLSGLRDLSASTDFILLNLALAKDTFLLTSGGFRVHVMSASSQISSCINNSSTSSRVIMPTTRYEDNTKLRFVKRNVTRSSPPTSCTEGRSKRVSILFSPTEYMYQRLSVPVLIDEPK